MSYCYLITKPRSDGTLPGLTRYKSISELLEAVNDGDHGPIQKFGDSDSLYHWFPDHSAPMDQMGVDGQPDAWILRGDVAVPVAETKAVAFFPVDQIKD